MAGCSGVSCGWYGYESWSREFFPHEQKGLCTAESSIVIPALVYTYGLCLSNKCTAAKEYQDYLSRRTSLVMLKLKASERLEVILHRRIKRHTRLMWVNFQPRRRCRIR